MQRAEFFRRFWSHLLELPESKIPIHLRAKPSNRSYMSLGYNSYLAFYYAVKRGEGRADIYINYPNPSKNEQIFNALFSHKEEIEGLFNAKLNWQLLKDKTPCRIGYEIEIGDFENNEATCKAIQIKMIDAMIRLEKSLSPFISKLS